MAPSSAASETTAASRSHQHSSSQQPFNPSFDPPSSLRSDQQPLPQQYAGAQSDSAPMSHKPSSSLSIGSRAPSVPLAQASSSHSMAATPAAQNMSTNSLSSLASGTAGIPNANARSPSPAYGASQSNDGGKGEAEQLRQQLQQVEAQHEAEVRRLNVEHEAHVAAVQAQAVAKMKELIEKVKAACGLSHGTCTAGSVAWRMQILVRILLRCFACARARMQACKCKVACALRGSTFHILLWQPPPVIVSSVIKLLHASHQCCSAATACRQCSRTLLMLISAAEGCWVLCDYLHVFCCEGYAVH